MSQREIIATLTAVPIRTKICDALTPRINFAVDPLDDTILRTTFATVIVKTGSDLEGRFQLTESQRKISSRFKVSGIFELSTTPVPTMS
jgi:hypothetical protein